jgi:hypothetical protein
MSSPPPLLHESNELDCETLERALGSLPDPPTPQTLPIALPPTHLSIARWFDSIVDDGELRPRTCGVFKEDLLYLFYGGVFYRTGNKHTRNVVELPIAFLFDPSVLSSCACYYPFDTGALAAGKYGNAAEPLMPFEKTYKVSGKDVSVPSRLVYHLFGTNERYLGGKVDKELPLKPAPLPSLWKFFEEDLTSHGVDQRQSIIECQTNEPIPLKSLLWIGFPESMTDAFWRLFELTKPSMPQYFQYESHVIFNPSDIAAKLEQEAAREVVRRFVQLPPRATAN